MVAFSTETSVTWFLGSTLNVYLSKYTVISIIYMYQYQNDILVQIEIFTVITLSITSVEQYVSVNIYVHTLQL
jgi:hypothetical protein